MAPSSAAWKASAARTAMTTILLPRLAVMEEMGREIAQILGSVYPEEDSRGLVVSL
jgi:hypothetical protein